MIRRAQRGAVNALLFAITLTLGCGSLHPFLPMPEIYAVREKLEWFRAHADEYDTLFIGTSRIYHQIIPELFDRLNAAKGISTRTFNAGVDGMRSPEDGYFLELLLEAKPRHLKWVFLELDSIRTPVDPAKRGTERNVYWHDWPRLAALFQDAAEVKKPSRHFTGRLRDLSRALSEVAEHARLYVENMANYGRAAFLLEPLLGSEAPLKGWGPLGPARDGFLEVMDRRVIAGADLEDYRRGLQWLREHPAVLNEGSVASQAAVARMVGAVSAAGATPLFLVTPTTAAKNFLPVDLRASDSPAFNFSDPDRYAELYEEARRLDTDHLNTSGAEFFTELVAKRFAEWRKKRE